MLVRNWFKTCLVLGLIVLGVLATTLPAAAESGCHDRDKPTTIASK